MSKQPKKKLEKRTKFTIFSMFNLVWYTIVVIVASFFDHQIPSELTVAWFSAWTVELAILFGIKLKNGDEEEHIKEVINSCAQAAAENIQESFEVQSEENMCDYSDDVG